MELELEYKTIIHPLNFFEGWSKEEFREWLHLDEFGNKMLTPREIDVVHVLNTIEPFGELGIFYDICLEELIKIKNNKNESKS